MGDSNTVGWSSFPNHNLHGITRKHLPDKVDLEQRKDEINEDLFAAAWMDLDIVILSEVSQRKTNNLSYCLNVELLKDGTNEFTYKTEKVTDVETNFGYWGGREGRDKSGNWHWCMHNTIPGVSGKESTFNAEDPGDMGLIPGLGRSFGEGTGNPLQYSCLESPMDRVAWWAIAKGLQRVGHNWVTEHTWV